MEYTRLSKTISRALRHAPEDYGLTLDAEGWVALDDLLAVLRPLHREWRTLDESDLRAMMAAASKQRFELTDGRMRALYGHSTPQRIEKTPTAPPDRLYHGTAPQTAQRILQEGLKPMRRQYVHLSSERETALMVGQRKAPQPVILTIRAADAHRAGIAFYHGNQDTWLADAVPPEFIERA